MQESMYMLQKSGQGCAHPPPSGTEILRLPDSEQASQKRNDLLVKPTPSTFTSPQGARDKQEKKVDPKGAFRW